MTDPHTQSTMAGLAEQIRRLADQMHQANNRAASQANPATGGGAGGGHGPQWFSQGAPTINSIPGYQRIEGTLSNLDPLTRASAVAQENLAMSTMFRTSSYGAGAAGMGGLSAHNFRQQMLYLGGDAENRIVNPLLSLSDQAGFFETQRRFAGMSYGNRPSMEQVMQGASQSAATSTALGISPATYMQALDVAGRAGDVGMGGKGQGFKQDQREFAMSIASALESGKLWDRLDETIKTMSGLTQQVVARSGAGDTDKIVQTMAKLNVGTGNDRRLQEQVGNLVGVADAAGQRASYHPLIVSAYMRQNPNMDFLHAQAGLEEDMRSGDPAKKLRAFSQLGRSMGIQNVGAKLGEFGDVSTSDLAKITMMSEQFGVNKTQMQGILQLGNIADKPDAEKSEAMKFVESKATLDAKSGGFKRTEDMIAAARVASAEGADIATTAKNILKEGNADYGSEKFAKLRELEGKGDFAGYQKEFANMMLRGDSISGGEKGKGALSSTNELGQLSQTMKSTEESWKEVTDANKKYITALQEAQRKMAEAAEKGGEWSGGWGGGLTSTAAQIGGSLLGQLSIEAVKGAFSKGGAARTGARGVVTAVANRGRRFAATPGGQRVVQRVSTSVPGRTASAISKQTIRAVNATTSRVSRTTSRISSARNAARSGPEGLVNPAVTGTSSKLLSGTSRFVGGAGGLLAVAGEVYEGYGQYQQNAKTVDEAVAKGEVSPEQAEAIKNKDIARQVSRGAGALAGAWAGAEAGALLGTFIGGPVGTVIGGLAGGAIGAVGGYYGANLGESAYNWITGSNGLNDDVKKSNKAGKGGGGLSDSSIDLDEMSIKTLTVTGEVIFQNASGLLNAPTALASREASGYGGSAMPGQAPAAAPAATADGSGTTGGAAVSGSGRASVVVPKMGDSLAVVANRTDKGLTISGANQNLLETNESIYISDDNFGKRGYRTHWGSDLHMATDLAVKAGTKLRSLGQMRVESVQQFASDDEARKTDLGNNITLSIGEGANKVFFRYGHLQTGSIGVKAGDILSAGQLFAATGNTGANTTGPHLDLMAYRKNGKQNIELDALAILGEQITGREMPIDIGSMDPNAARTKEYIAENQKARAAVARALSTGGGGLGDSGGGSASKVEIVLNVKADEKGFVKLVAEAVNGKSVKIKQQGDNSLQFQIDDSVSAPAESAS